MDHNAYDREAGPVPVSCWKTTFRTNWCFGILCDHGDSFLPGRVRVFEQTQLRRPFHYSAHASCNNHHVEHGYHQRYIVVLVSPSEELQCSGFSTRREDGYNLQYFQYYIPSRYILSSIPDGIVC